MNPISLDRRRLTLGALAASGLALTGCSSHDAAPGARFLLLDGSTLQASALKGQVTLVNFWATTCVTCVHEMPQLVSTYQKFRDKGFDTIAVAMHYDPPQWVQNFTRTRQLPFKVALDSDGELARQWGEVKLTPTTFIVDRQARVVKRYVGEPDFAALHRLLEQLLAQA
jgi:peroxiredoxin